MLYFSGEMKARLGYWTFVLLAICVWLNLFGTFFLFWYQQQALKQEMKEYLARHLQHAAVTKLVLSAQQQATLYWEDDSEFSFNGQMYDVVKKETKGSDLVVYCVPDEKETTLIQEYVQQHKRPAKEKTTFQLLTDQFVSTQTAQPIADAPFRLVHVSSYHFLLPFIARNILAPPPRAIA